MLHVPYLPKHWIRQPETGLSKSVYPDQIQLNSGADQVITVCHSSSSYSHMSK